MESMYRAGIVYARRYKAAGRKDDLDALETIKKALGVVEPQWRVAGNTPLSSTVDSTSVWMETNLCRGLS